MVEILLDELGKPASLIQHVEDRPGHDRRYCLNVDKLMALGWQPRHTHEEAIRETVRWYAANEWWWRKIKSGEFKEYYRKLYGRPEGDSGRLITIPYHNAHNVKSLSVLWRCQCLPAS